MPLVSNKISTCSFSTITSNFIIDLPKYNGYNAIHCVVDRSIRTVVVTPCQNMITSDNTVDLLLNHNYQHFGLWDKLITDCGPQFVSQVMQAIYK